MAQIPPWLQGADIPGEYARGLQLGASIGEAQQRVQAEQERTQLEFAAREKTQQREQNMQNQRLATEQALQGQRLQLHQAALDQAAQKNQQATQSAALKFADQAGYAKDLAAGMSPEQALYRHPRLTTPAAAIAAQKVALDSTADRVDIARRNLDLREREIKNRENKPPTSKRVGETETIDPETGAKTRKYLFDTPSMPVPPQSAQAGPAKVASQKEFDALAPGALYVNPKDGKTYRKKSTDKPAEQQ